MDPEIELLSSPEWVDYELLDSGNRAKLERFGSYIFIRPEYQAMWRPALPPKKWESAHAVFRATSEETGGKWQIQKTIELAWPMEYKGLVFKAHLTTSRHLGVFPEQANHWDWVDNLIRGTNNPVRVLNLFGYTGLATLAAARAGAIVTHVDAAKKPVNWARENQSLSGLGQHPIRWIIDDAYKFAQRESRRGAQYDGIILDPPKFGRGPKGEVWEFFEALPHLLETCRSLFSTHPLFIVVTAYAIRVSALSLYHALQEILTGMKGTLVAGELVIQERSARRLISTAIFARWSSGLEDGDEI